LNHRLVKHHPENWDEAAMQKRALDLFEAANTIWPDPATLAGRI